MAIKDNVLTWLGISISEEDFAGFYQAELPRIYNFFRYRVGDGPLAEDLTSETFEKAWRNRARYKRDLAAFSTWLFTIARRVAQDYYRKQHRHEISLEDVSSLSEIAIAAQECRAEQSFQPEDLIEQKADFARLSVLLARLADRERELVALKYGAGLTNRTIARLTGLSESNVGVILFRVVQMLRSNWEGPL